MENPELGALLAALASDERQKAWKAFLQQYASIMYQVAHTFARDSDETGECFLFACEELARNRFRRLRSFDPGGRARFTTWLRAVVRNLCVDWHRKRYGRRRLFRSIASLPTLDQQVFRLCFQEQHTADEAYEVMRVGSPGVTRLAIEESLERIRCLLSARQLWLLSSGHGEMQPLSSLEAEPGQEGRSVADPAPDPETLTAMRERHALLEQAMEKLESTERLLLQLRFEENLALREVARLLGLKDAQTADRRIREVLEKLRSTLQGKASSRGKTQAVSV